MQLESWGVTAKVTHEEELPYEPVSLRFVEAAKEGSEPLVMRDGG